MKVNIYVTLYKCLTYISYGIKRELNQNDIKHMSIRYIFR